MPKEYLIRKKAVEILTKNNWVCWWPPKVKFKQSDIFGIIDLLALRGKKLKKIQLTTLPNVSVRRKKIISFLKKFRVDLSVEIWAWDKKKRRFREELVNIKKLVQES